MRICITAEVGARNMAAFIDGFNDWARQPDVAALFESTTDTPTGSPEPSYELEVAAS